jgi:hypothetical protein
MQIKENEEFSMIQIMIMMMMIIYVVQTYSYEVRKENIYLH